MAIIHPEYWGRDFGPGFSFLYLLTTQMIGLVNSPETTIPDITCKFEPVY
jgi:hypothetical protein